MEFSVNLTHFSCSFATGFVCYDRHHVSELLVQLWALNSDSCKNCRNIISVIYLWSHTGKVSRQQNKKLTSTYDVLLLKERNCTHFFLVKSTTNAAIAKISTLFLFHSGLRPNAWVGSKMQTQWDETTEYRTQPLADVPAKCSQELQVSVSASIFFFGFSLHSSSVTSTWLASANKRWSTSFSTDNNNTVSTFILLPRNPSLAINDTRQTRSPVLSLHGAVQLGPLTGISRWWS